MKRSLIALIVLTLTQSLFSATATHGPAGDAIAIRVYNYAGIPAEQISGAQQAADDIFARSNVRLSWLNCTLDAERKPADPTCMAVRGPSVLNLRLMPEQMAPQQGLRKGIFGFSLMSTTGGYSSTTNVYVERVDALTDGRKYRQPVVLGAVIAHELGHLLLGIGSHSKAGLMSLPWGPKALTAADKSVLGFSKRETQQLERAVAARTRSAI
jgi:hypothetical protein